MTSKSAGQIAYEARFPHAGGSHGEKLWKDQSRDVHELWDRIAEAVRLKVTEPVPGWRESGAEDPHGTRYACPLDRIAGGHLTHDQVAFAVAMADRRDLGLEGVLNVAKDRIRWLARRLHMTEKLQRDTVRDANGMREELGLRASRITALEADLQALEHRRRWNVMEGENGTVLICQNLHAKHEPCDYVAYVPAERLERLEADRATAPIGLPPGAIQAYSDAYKAARNGPNHLDCHVAGLRACIVHAATMMLPGVPGPAAVEETRHPMPAGGAAFFLTEAERICGTDRVSGIYTAPAWDELSEDGQLWVAAILQQATEDLSTETLDILRRAAPFVDWCCGEGHCPLWDGAYVDPVPVHDIMAKMLGVDTLHALQENPDAPAPATPYEIVGTTYDGVEILAPKTLSERFTRQDISDAITLIRGPRSAEMAAIVEATNNAFLEVL